MSVPAAYAAKVASGATGASHTISNDRRWTGFLPGQVYFFSFFYKADRITGTANATIRAAIEWFNTAGTSLGTTHNDITVSTTVGWTFREDKHMVPASAYEARVVFTVTPAASPMQHDVYLTAAHVALTERGATFGADYWSNVDGRPEGDAIIDDFSHADDTAFLQRWTNHGGAGERTFGLLDSGIPGGKYMRVGNNSGDDQNWLIGGGDPMAFDPNALYECEFYVRKVAGSGFGYLGLAGLAADKTTFVTIDGSNSPSNQHYVALSGVQPAASWTRYVGYVRGHAATGSNTPKADPAFPGQMHTNVRYIKPLVLVNYNIAAGQTDIAFVRVRKVTEPVISRGNTAPTSPRTGDQWTDTNVTPNVVKRWNGTAWESVANLTTQGSHVGVANGAGTAHVWTPIGSTLPTVLGNTASKTTADNTWSSAAVGPAFAGTSYVSMTRNSSGWTMLALDVDATTYSAAGRYNVQISGNNAWFYVNGGLIGLFTLSASATIIMLVYDGQTVKLYADATLVASAAAAGANETLYPKIYLYSANVTHSNFQAGAYTDRSLAPVSLVTYGSGAAINGNGYTISALQTANTAGVYSRESFVEGVTCEFSFALATGEGYAGLADNSVASTGAAAQIKYGFYALVSGLLYTVVDGAILATGQNVGTARLRVVADGVNVRWYRDNVLLRTVARTDTGMAFKFQSTEHKVGAGVTGLAFYPSNRAAWSSLGGTGLPSDNAGTTLTFTSQNVTVRGNAITPTSAVANASAVSREFSIGNAFVAGYLNSAENSFLGLTTYATAAALDAGTTFDYMGVKYGWFFQSGVWYRNENGTLTSHGSGYTANTLFAVIHDGVSVRFYADGTLVHTSTQPTSTTETLRAVAGGYNSATANVTGLIFGAYTQANFSQIGGSTRPEDLAERFALVTGPEEIVLEADHLGNLVGTSPYASAQFQLVESGVAVTTGITWTRTTPSGVTTAIAGTGTLFLDVTALTVNDQNGVLVTLTAARSGRQNRVHTVRIRKNLAPPPVSGGGSGGSGTSASTTTLGNTVGTDYTGTPGESAVLTVQAGSAGQVACSTGSLTYKRTPGTADGQTGAYGKWQWRVSSPPGSWADIGTEVAYSTAADTDVEPGTATVNYAGSLSVNQTKTGLTNGTSYDFKFVWRRADLAGDSDNVYRTGGTLSAVGS